MKQRIILLFLAAAGFSFQFSTTDTATSQLDELVDNWHLAASQADFTNYFNVVTDDFVFLGTDPTERWERKPFEAFCKPYFEKGKAWDFKASDRHWVFSKKGDIAWFDEKLDTWMNTCRGSGVLVKEKNVWKLAYYNLTVLIENEKIKSFVELRKN
jgi:hypothetical protein